jgi:tol-pal system protein YbgF
LSAALLKKLFVFAVGLGLVSGCYSTKMMEFTYQELDTVKTTQQELLERIDELTLLYEQEREMRVRTQAENALALKEIRDALEMLAFRVDDSAQLIMSRQNMSTLFRIAGAVDSLGADSLGTALTDSLFLAARDSTGASPPVIANDEAGKLFQTAYMDLTLGNYDLSLQGFKNYLVRFPDAPNAPDAHYYLGESYYAMERHLEAVAEYQSVIKDYPRSRLVAACYLKSGYCYRELEESHLAEKAFRELISRYPRSEEAEQARVALQELGE